MIPKEWLIFIVMIFQCFLVSCQQNNSQQVEKNTLKNSLPIESDKNTNSTNSKQITDNLSKTPEEEVVDQKEKHEAIYKRRLKIITAVKELTEMDSLYLGRKPTEEEEEARKKRIYLIVDKFESDSEDLITLATICNALRWHNQWEYGKYLAYSNYEIAFYYSIKTVATKHQNNEYIMWQLKELGKLVGDSSYNNFKLSLEGKDPEL